MKKPIQISVPKPCSEDWNKMTPQEQGRFCDACQKCVIDFTHMTDSQLYRFMKKHEGENLCGNFLPSQLDRPLAPPVTQPNRFYRWAAAAGLTLLFTQWPKGEAKAQAANTQITIQDSTATGIRSISNMAVTPPIDTIHQNEYSTRTAGIIATHSGDLTIRGARGEGTRYIIDGVQVVPQKTPNFFQRTWSSIKNIFRRKD